MMNYKEKHEKRYREMGMEADLAFGLLKYLTVGGTMKLPDVDLIAEFDKTRDQKLTLAEEESLDCFLTWLVNSDLRGEHHSPHKMGAERCECGEMTLKRAMARGHRCAPPSSEQREGQKEKGQR